MFGLLKKAVSFVASKIDDALSITKRVVKSKGFDVDDISNSELRRRVGLINEVTKRLQQKEKTANTSFIKLTGEEDEMTALDYWKQTRNYERYQNLPDTLIPQGVRTDEQMKQLNDYLEKALSIERKEEMMANYRSNFLKSLDDIFEEEQAEILKEKFNMISDEQLEKSFRIYEVLDIHSWSPPEGISSQNPLADIYEDINNSLDRLLNE